MHLIVPFAVPLAEDGRAALQTLDLPHLRRLLAGAGRPQHDRGDAWSLSPPHERVLARAFGWSGGDGGLPFAAWWAAADGLQPADQAWGLITPSHWHLGTDQVSLLDPAALHLDADESRRFLAVVQEVFVSEGFAVAWGAPLRWYVAHESLASLRTASLDRVIGRNVDRWLTGDAALRRLRRMQNEVQMLLHEHPLNEARAARGELPLNSFWLSGCGVAQPVQGVPPRIDERLRGPALAGDWAAWARAWRALDEGPLAELGTTRGRPWRLTLCGECGAVSVDPAAGAWSRLRARFARSTPVTWMETL